MHVQNDIHMGGCDFDPRHRDFARSIVFYAHFAMLNREKPAFAHHSSRHVTSSLHFEVISALGARLLRSFRYAQSRKVGFRLRRGSLFPSTRARKYHSPVDGG